ncbi:MAG: hypothetical protein EHM70_10160 [Chloroflexota bacterium]|nr:MAG: hypothetical protein EHM70_10160 [Chloroflexota bacterium]
MTPYLLKLGLIFFWALWLSIVFLTNLFDGLKALKILPPQWKLASGNYEKVASAARKYTLPNWVNGALFGGVVLWEGLSAALMWRSFAGSLGLGVIDSGLALAGFALSAGLWAIMMIADEIFGYYDGESQHLLLFIANLVTLIVIYLLP